MVFRFDTVANEKAVVHVPAASDVFSQTPKVVEEAGQSEREMPILQVVAACIVGQLYFLASNCVFELVVDIKFLVA